MPRKSDTSNEIAKKLREVDVLVSRGQVVADAAREIGITEVTYYRWRRKFSGVKSEQAKRLRELENENARLGGLSWILRSISSF